MMHRNQSVNVHQFAMIPKADVPRSSFDIQSAHKTTSELDLGSASVDDTGVIAPASGKKR